MPGPEFDVTERSSDEELMRLLADGRASIQARKRACDQLVLRWYDYLKDYARRLFRASAGGSATDADDVVQEAFALVLEKASLFDPSRRLAPWLRSVVHNLALNLRRRESRYQGLGFDWAQFENRDLPPLDDLASREWFVRLTPDERALFEAVFFSGEKVKDLATRRGEPPSKVYRTLQELKHRVRSTLRPCEQGPGPC